MLENYFSIVLFSLTTDSTE